MRAARNALVLLLSFFPFSTRGDSPTDVIASLPLCAVSEPDRTFDEADLETQLSCLATAIVDSPCRLTNTPCICANTSLTQTVEVCVLASCTIKESLGKWVKSDCNTLSLPSKSQRTSLQQLVGLPCEIRAIGPVCQTLHCLFLPLQSALRDLDTTRSTLQSDGATTIIVGVLDKANMTPY